MVSTLACLDNTHNLPYINPVPEALGTLMRKEVFIAILAGLSIGLIIAFGVWRVNSNQLQITEQNLTSDSRNLNSVKNEIDNNKLSPQNKLSLTGIEDGQIFTETPININGLATGSNRIIISGEVEDYVVQPDSEFTFAESVKLNKGINNISFVALNQEGEEIDELVFTVVYYPDFEN